MTDDRPSIADPALYAGCPIPYVRATTCFALPTATDASLWDAMARRTIHEAGLCLRPFGTHDVTVRARAALSHMEPPDRPGDASHMVLGPDGFVPANLGDNWTPVPGFTSRFVRMDGVPYIVGRDFLLGCLTMQGVNVRRSVRVVRDRIRVMDFGVHVADDPVHVQMAAAFAAGHGLEIEQGSPLSSHLEPLLLDLQPVAEQSYEDCLDLVCARSIQDGLLDDAPRDAVMNVVAVALAALEERMPKGAGWTDLASRLGCLPIDFQPMTGSDRERWRRIHVAMHAMVPPGGEVRALILTGRDADPSRMDRAMEGLTALDPTDAAMVDGKVAELRRLDRGYVVTMVDGDGLVVGAWMPG